MRLVDLTHDNEAVRVERRMSARLDAFAARGRARHVSMQTLDGSAIVGWRSYLVQVIVAVVVAIVYLKRRVVRLMNATVADTS